MLFISENIVNLELMLYLSLEIIYSLELNIVSDYKYLGLILKKLLAHYVVLLVEH